MKLFLLFLMSFQYAEAEPIRPLLESTAFNKICEKTVFAKPPFEVLGQTWSNFYLIRRPSFTEDNQFVYIGIKVAPNEKGNYAIFRVSKTHFETIEEIYRFPDQGHDVLQIDGRLWILKDYGITAVDMENGERSDISFPENPTQHKYDRAYDMELVGNKVVVANGTSGLTVIDKDSMALEKPINLGLIESNGHKALAVSVAKPDESGNIYVGVSHLTMPVDGVSAFNGIMLANVHSGNLLKKYPYNKGGSGILSHVSKIKVVDGTLWLNNFGIIQYIPIDSLVKQKAAFTQWIPTTYFEDGKKWYAEPLGEFFVIGNDHFSCAQRSQLMTTKPEKKKGVALRLRNGGKAKTIEFKKYKLKINPLWLDGPYVSDFKTSALKVEVHNSKGELVPLPNGLSLNFYAIMPSMQHPAMDMGFFEEEKPGIYVNQSILLGMSGDWSMELWLQNSDEVVEKVKILEFL